jgi:hypothetical protein
MCCNTGKYVLQHRKINHETWKMGPFGKHLLQQPKNPIATSKNICCNIPKNPLQHGGNSKRRTNSKRDGFEVQPALALTHHL